MKPRAIAAGPRLWACRLLGTLVILPLALVTLSGAPGAAGPTRASGKPYTLFMGADLSVEWHGKLWPVQGVRRNAFEVEADGERVPVRDTELRMKVVDRLKMTTTYATVTKLKAERAYTPQNDPRQWAHDVSQAASVASDGLDIAAYNLNRLQSIAGRGSSTVTPEMLASANDAFQRSLADQGSDRYSTPDAVSREQTELARKLFDAFRMSFEISSNRPLTDPYLVVMVRFRERADNPETARMLVYAQVLPAIDQRPQTVRLMRGGFPRGYQLVDSRIHLYDHGTEVPTSATPNQMAMTKDEAFQYSLVDYATRHRDQTRPPAPAGAFWPRDLAARLPGRELDRLLYVKVRQDGRVAGFYGDQACTRPVRDATLEAVRTDLRFEPALDYGKPVEGVIVLNLGQHID